MQLLDEGVAKLGLSIGIFSHVYGGIYQIVAISSSVDGWVAGATLPVEDTYCRDVVRSGKTLAITGIAGTPGLGGHPLYVKIPLEAYIGAPVFCDDRTWGTVNFTSFRLHAPFTREDRRLVEGYARILAEQIDALGYGATAH